MFKRFGEPTTSSPYKEFDTFLYNIGHEVRYFIEMFAKQHREMSQSGGGHWTGGRPGYLDKDDLSISWSTFFNMMFAALEQIQDAEQRLEFIEADEDSEEYQQALGELFGVKSVFIALYKSFSGLEMERIDATKYQYTPEKFMHQIIRGGGSTSGESIEDWKSGYSPNSFTTNRVMASDIDISKLTTFNKTTSFNL